jgi:hypothetical protein
MYFVKKSKPRRRRRHNQYCHTTFREKTLQQKRMLDRASIDAQQGFGQHSTLSSPTQHAESGKLARQVGQVGTPTFMCTARCVPQHRLPHQDYLNIQS